MTDSVRLGDYSSQDVRARQAAGWVTVVQGFGSVEAHGPHLATGTDGFQGDAIAERVARRLGNAFVAPTLWIGCTDQFLIFPGTLSLSEATFEAVVYDCCRSLAATGFRRYLPIVAHAGNCDPLARAIERARADFPDLEIVADPSLAAFIAPFSHAGNAMGVTAEARNHGGHSETSMMLALHPDHVWLDRAVPGFPGTREESRRLLAAGKLGEVAPNGVIGDASGASAEAGERYLDSWVEHIVALVERTHR